MARYIDADKFIERIKVSPAFPNMGMDGEFLQGVVIDLLNNAPTADVVPKKEIANVLCDLKIAVHNKAHYNHAQEVPSYITLKVFDAVIRDYLNKLEKG